MKKFALTLALIGGLGAAVAVGAHAREHGPDGGRGPMMARMMHMTPEDRAAFLDARLAAVKAGLKLTPDQEKLWPPVETAVRDNMKAMTDLRDQMKAADKPTDMMDGLTRMADATSARADGLHKLADAAKPLYASLDDAQKGRLPVLLHGAGRGEGGGGHRWGK